MKSESNKTKKRNTDSTNSAAAKKVKSVTVKKQKTTSTKQQTSKSSSQKKTSSTLKNKQVSSPKKSSKANNNNRWNAEERFKPNTIKPPSKHKDSEKKLKYVVWCSDGYDNDGWHSYHGPPTKEFDTSWNTKKEANERAEYLFFWKNPWGIEPEEVNDYDEGRPTPEKTDGMQKWTAAPADSSRWTVGVVPSAAYPHLKNSSQQRHTRSYDEDSNQSSLSSSDDEDSE